MAILDSVDDVLEELAPLQTLDGGELAGVAARAESTIRTLRAELNHQYDFGARTSLCEECSNVRHKRMFGRKGYKPDRTWLLGEIERLKRKHCGWTEGDGPCRLEGGPCEFCAIHTEVTQLRSRHNPEVCVDTQEYCERLREAAQRVLNDGAGPGVTIYRVSRGSIDALRMAVRYR